MSSPVRACVAATFALVAACALPMSAQWEPWPMKNVPRLANGKVDMNAPARRTADGKIDLSGFWMPTNPVKHLLNLAADLKPGEVPLQPGPRRGLTERELRLAGLLRRHASLERPDLSQTFCLVRDFQSLLAEVRAGITAETPSQTDIVLKGADKQLLGQVAAEIRAFRPPEPYKGKGVRYADEQVRRKEAKTK